MAAQKAILCVDDEKIILDSIKDQLKHFLSKDIILEFAESPSEAIEIIEDLEAEGIEVMLVVSDWLMPGMKGDEFLIKVHESKPNMVKMMLTGQADSEAIERVKSQANLFRLLTKPWKEEELINAINDGITNM